MARTDQQAFLNAYLGGGISANGQKIKSAGSAGSVVMSNGANISIPSLYDFKDDINKVSAAYMEAAQNAVKEQQQAAEKAAQQAAKKAQQKAKKAQQKAEKEQREEEGKKEQESEPDLSIEALVSKIAKSSKSSTSNNLPENEVGSNNPQGTKKYAVSKVSVPTRGRSMPTTVRNSTHGRIQEEDQVQEEKSYSNMNTAEKMNAQKILRTTLAFGSEEEKEQAQKELNAVEKALWDDKEYLQLVKKSLENEPQDSRIERYLDPAYKLNKVEQQDAKDIAGALLDQSNSMGRTAIGTDPNTRQQAQELFDTAQRLHSKTSNAQAILAGALDAIPLFRETLDTLSGKINEQLYPGEDRPTTGDSFQNLQTQSPIAYTTGTIGGNLALYSAASAAARGIPALQSFGQTVASTPAAQAVQGLPVIGRLGTADAIAGMTGDALVDLSLDTLPRLGSNLIEYNQQQNLIQQGLAEGNTMDDMLPALQEYYGEYLTPGSIAADTLQNVGTNFALGLGGEIVPELFRAGSNALRRGANAAQSGVDDATRAIADTPLPAVENATQAAQNSADDVINAWRNGTLTNAQMETLKPNSVNRAAFEQATGVKLPDTSSETRQFLRQPAQSPSVEPDITSSSVAASMDDVSPSVSAPVGNTGNASRAADSSTTAGPEIPPGYKERGFAESIRNKTDLPDEVKQEFVDNPELYRAISNSETSARADAIYSQGLDRSMVEYNRMLSEKDPAAVPLGKKIADDLISQGRRDEAVEVLRQMSQNLTQSGQFSQAAAIALLKNDPMTALQYIQKNIDRMNQEGLQKFGAKKWKNFSLTPEEIDGFSKIEYGDEDALKSAFEQIGKRIQRDYPVTTMQKLVEASHIAMLLNPRTQIRNAAANLAFRPLNILSRKVSATAQNIYKQFDKTYQPNQAFSISKKSKDLASEAYNMVRDSLAGNTSGKWENTLIDSARNADVFKLRGDTNLVSRLPVLGNAFGALNESLGNFSRSVTGGQNVFENLSSAKSVGENIRQFTYGLLELGDQPFLRKEFIDRMGSYIEARGYKSLDEIPNEAFDAATQSALKATFKDDNRLTRLVSSVKRESGLVGEVVLPFTKTPANIAVRAYDYSPAGLAMGIRRWVKNGGDPNAYIDEISKGLTGTAAIVLGGLLYKAGVITGPASENADQAQYDKMQGKLPFAINVGGNYYTFDWMQPASSSLVLGSTLASQIEKNGGLDAESLAEAIRTSLVSMGDTLLDMSPLQSVADIFGGYGTPTENVLSEFAEVPQRLIPSLTGAITRIVDPVQRQTFSNGDPVGTQLASAQSKIPGLSQSLPAAYDTWGREMTRADNIGEGIFNQFVNPGEFGNANPTPMDDEISRLFEATGQTSVFPQKANWTETFGGESHKLSNEEYSDYQRTMGQISYQGAFSLMDSQLYNALDDQQKAAALESVYSVGRYKALQEIFPDYQVPASAQKSVDVYDAMGADGLASWLEYKTVADADGSGSISQEEAQAALNAIPGLTGDEMAYFYYLTNKNWKNNPYM